MQVLHDEAAFRRLGLSPAAAGLLLALIGLSVWIGLSILGGIDNGAGPFRPREAWDTPAYFYVGLPLMALAVAAVGYHLPQRVWRWPLWLVAGHQAGILILGAGMQSGLSLIVLTAALAVLLASFLAIPALVGSMAARRFA